MLQVLFKVFFKVFKKRIEARASKAQEIKELQNVEAVSNAKIGSCKAALVLIARENDLRK